MAKKSKKERKERKQLQMKERAAKKEKQREGSKPKIKKEAEPEPLPRQSKQLKLTGKQIQATILKRKKQVEARPKPVKRNEEPLDISLKQLKKGIQARKKQMQEPGRTPTTTAAPEYTPTPEKQNRIEKAAEERIPLLPGDMVKIPPDSVITDTNFFSDAVIRGFENIIKQFPKNAEPILKEWLDEMIARNGKDDVATMLQQGAADGHIVNREIAYDAEKLGDFMNEMMDYLPEMTDWAKAEVMESFETWDFFV